VAASQVSLVGDVATALGWAVLAFVLYLAAAAPLAWVITKIFSMEFRAGRTLAFNMGTRNSFVVLPLALSLPAGWEAAVAAIVLQSIVELSGIVAYLWWVPRWLFPATTEGR
ncbi:MAG: arsenic resistance protein, partial [Chloroflexota bacterium]